MKKVCAGSKVKVSSVDTVDILKGIAVGDTGEVMESDDYHFNAVLMDKDHLVAFLSTDQLVIL